MWLRSPAGLGISVPAHLTTVPVPTAASASAARVIPIEEIGEALAPVVDEIGRWRIYEEFGLSQLPSRLMLRVSAQERILAASRGLPPDFCITVLDGWRSREFQEELHTYYSARMPTVEGFVSDPDDDALVAPHRTGGAVDLTLSYRGVALALGSEYDSFIADAALRAFEVQTSVRNQDFDLVRNLRRMLAGALLAQGFAPFDTEWWHWSYGDQRWASFYGARAALFDPVDNACG